MSSTGPKGGTPFSGGGAGAGREGAVVNTSSFFPDSLGTGAWTTTNALSFGRTCNWAQPFSCEMRNALGKIGFSTPEDTHPKTAPEKNPHNHGPFLPRAHLVSPRPNAHALNLCLHRPAPYEKVATSGSPIVEERRPSWTVGLSHRGLDLSATKTRPDPPGRDTG